MKARHAFVAIVGRSGIARTRLPMLSLSICVLALAIVASAGASKGVLTHFGSQGSGDGQFETPRGVAVNASGAGAANAGDVYVVDELNSRVERFDADGDYLAQFGAAGSEAGQLAAPKNVAVDQSTGNVYVIEAGNVRVQAFDAAGNFLWMAGNGVNTGTSGNPDLCTGAGAPTDVCGAATAGTLGGQLGAIGTLGAGLAVAPAGSPNAGNLLLADPGNRRVQELTSAGAFVRAFGWDVNSPDGDAAFEECTLAAECLAGDAGANAGQFAGGQPTDVAEDSTGAVYALERLRLQKFTPQVGPPALSPQGAFDPTDLTGSGARPLGNVAVGASDHVFAVRTVSAGTSTCPDGSASIQERLVYELDSSGALQETHMGCARITPTNGLGLNAATGLIYVSTTAVDHRVYVLDDIAPPSATALAPSEVETTTATLEGTVNPNGTALGDQTSYAFELSEDGGSSWTPLASQDAGTGIADLPVSFAATGLQPNKEYEYRLRAAKAFGNPIATSAPVAFSTDAVAPGVSLATTTASDDRATLRSRLNPNNSPSTYRFEYGQTAAYGSQTAETAAGSGFATERVEAPITGLQSDSTYHYRIVATNGAGTTHGPDRTLTTGPGLPEDRHYEMVSPPDKLGNDISIDPTRTRAATDGSALQFLSLGAFGDARGTGVATEYMAVRSTDGWRTHSITPPTKPQPVQQAIYGYDARDIGEFSADLGTAVYTSRTPLTEGDANVAEVKNLYLRRDLLQPGAAGFELLTQSDTPQVEPTDFEGEPNSYQPFYAGASSDFSHVIFTSGLNLTSDAPEQDPLFCGLGGFCEPRLYEHTTAGVRLAGQIPESPATECVGAECVPAVRSIAGQASQVGHYATDTISTDGRRIFFTVADSSTGREGVLYLREDGSTTIQINASEKASPDAPQPAKFWNAGKDGSVAFFTTTEQLVDQDTDTLDDLYRWDRAAPEGGRLTRVSVDGEPTDFPEPVFDVYGASDDGSYVYFISKSQLVAGQPLISEGDYGVFAWHDGGVAFVGFVTTEDTFANIPVSWTLNSRGPRVTPDGRHLVFLSQSASQPTGDSSAPCAEGPCRRVYVYSATANGGEGELICASCRPDGSPSTAPAYYDKRVDTGGSVSDPHLNDPITADGRLVFFSTADRLVPDDVNGRVDAYSYDTVNGQVRLISTGRCDCDSYFLEATPSGSDAFFATRERLLGWDNDNLTDIYDARVGGGLPEPPTPPPSCQGDSCQPPPADVARPGLATSATKGPGNPAGARPKPRTCPRGKRSVRSHGKTRCAPKQRNRTNRANTNRRASR